MAIRVLVAKAGLDGHDRGAKAVALALRDAGFEVLYSGLHRTPQELGRIALQEDVDLVGLSVLSGAHVELARRLAEILRPQGTPLVVGGVVPAEDEAALRALGVEAIFRMGTPFGEIADWIRKRCGNGAERPAPARPAPAPAEPKVVLESGIEVKPVYTADDAAGIDPGRPGEFPFTRGIHELMYRKQPWTMRQYAGFGTPAQTNARFRALLAHGQTALNVAFDLPTQLGLDSDDPRAQGEVGRVGMAVDTLEDFKRAFDGIPLGEVSTALTINAPALILLAMHLGAAREQGVAAERVVGTLQNDILKEFVGRGAWVFPIGPSVRMVADSIEFCARQAPKYNAVSVCGYHLRESGATPDQEMALAFEIARAYIDVAAARGLGIDDIAPRITFNFNVYGNLWEQVAKFRGGRRRWAKIVRDVYGARRPKSMQLRMIAGGGGGGLTIREPENNVVRGAYYALAAALGGAQTMALCCYDEAYSIPTEQASLTALRTMQILAEETGVCDTVDPLAGSYYVEWLTARMEEKIEAAEQEVKTMGGILRSIEQGTLQRKLAAQAYAYERRLQSGDLPKVGVNRHAAEAGHAPTVEIHRHDAAWAETKVRELRELRASRSNDAVRTALDGVRRAAAGTDNLVPPILEAVTARATIGEITGALKEVFGEFREPRF